MEINTLDHNGQTLYYITGISEFGNVTQFGTEIITKKKRKNWLFGPTVKEPVLGGTVKNYLGTYGEKQLAYPGYWQACLDDFIDTINNN